MENADDSVEVTFDFLQSDLLRGNVWWLTRQKLLVFIYVLFSLVLILGLVSGALRGWGGVSPPWHLLFFAFVLVFIPLSAYLGVRRTYAQVKPEQVRKCYRFASAGFSVSDSLSNADVSWKAVQRAVETQHAFHLFVQKQWFHVVPRRAFSGDELARTRAILRVALGPSADLRADLPGST